MPHTPRVSDRPLCFWWTFVAFPKKHCPPTFNCTSVETGVSTAVPGGHAFFVLSVTSKRPGACGLFSSPIIARRLGLD